MNSIQLVSFGMFTKMLKGKIHRATVTGSHIDYPGSIGIDSKLLGAAAILPYEAVTVLDVTNGSRLETYAVPEEAGSGKITILGAAAHLIKKNDIIIIMSFGYFTDAETRDLKPRIVIADRENGIKEVL